MGYNEMLCAMEPRLRLKRFSPQAKIKPGHATDAEFIPVTVSGGGEKE